MGYVRTRATEKGGRALNFVKLQYHAAGEKTKRGMQGISNTKNLQRLHGSLIA